MLRSCRNCVLFAGLFLLTWVPVCLANTAEVNPAPDSVFKGRKPKIEVALTVQVDITSLLVLLDGTDITPSCILSADKITYTSPVPVAGGEHTVEIVGTNADSTPLYLKWSFTVKHSEKYDEIRYSSDLTASYSVNLDEKEESGPIPDWVLEASGPLNFYLKKDHSQFSLTGSVYYYQQGDEPGLDAADEGGDFRNFLLTGRWSGDRTVSTLEVGDLGVEETYYTAPNLYRRGARYTLGFERRSISLFSLSSQPVVGVRDGLKAGTDPDRNMLGTSFRATSTDGRTGFHLVYMTGRDETGYGVSLPEGTREGEVVGAVLGRTLIPNKLSLHLEGASSSFDPDLTDTEGEERDWALFTGFTWLPAPKITVKASAEHVGQEFRSIGSPDALNDFDKLSFAGDIFLKKHTLNLETSWSRSNVEDDGGVPVSTQIALDAVDNWSASDRISLQTRLYADTVRSSDEPAGFTPFDTQTALLSSQLYYIRAPWSLGTLLSLSSADDTTSADLDREQQEVRLDLAYTPSNRLSISATAPQFIRDRDTGNGVDYETLTSSLLLASTLVSDALYLDISGSYTLYNASDDSADQVSSGASARLSWSLAKYFPEYASPAIALGGEQSRTIDKVADSDLNQHRVFLTLELRSQLNY